MLAVNHIMIEKGGIVSRYATDILADYGLSFATRYAALVSDNPREVGWTYEREFASLIKKDGFSNLDLSKYNLSFGKDSFVREFAELIPGK